MGNNCGNERTNQLQIIRGRHAKLRARHALEETVCTGSARNQNGEAVTSLASLDFNERGALCGNAERLETNPTPRKARNEGGEGARSNRRRKKGGNERATRAGPGRAG